MNPHIGLETNGRSTLPRGVRCCGNCRTNFVKVIEGQYSDGENSKLDKKDQDKIEGYCPNCQAPILRRTSK